MPASSASLPISGLWPPAIGTTGGGAATSGLEVFSGMVEGIVGPAIGVEVAPVNVGVFAIGVALVFVVGAPEVGLPVPSFGLVFVAGKSEYPNAA